MFRRWDISRLMVFCILDHLTKRKTGNLMNEFTDIHPELAALYASSYAPATTRLSSDDYFVCFPVGKESTATFTGEPREFGGFLCLTHVDLLLGSSRMPSSARKNNIESFAS